MKMILSIERINEELENLGAIKKASRKCSRCKGLGWIANYSHVERGICYNCRGVGKALTKKEAIHNAAIEALNGLIKHENYLEDALSEHVVALENAKNSKWPKVDARSAENELLHKHKCYKKFIDFVIESLDAAKIEYDKIYDIEELQ